MRSESSYIISLQMFHQRLPQVALLFPHTHNILPPTDPAQYERLHRSLMMRQHIIQPHLRRPYKCPVAFGFFRTLHVPDEMVVGDEVERVLLVPFREPVDYSLSGDGEEGAFRYEIDQAGGAVEEILLCWGSVGSVEQSNDGTKGLVLNSPHRFSRRFMMLRYAEPTPMKKTWGASLQLRTRE